jgi:hypothetical protein
VEDYVLLDFDLLDKDVLSIEDDDELNDWWTMHFYGVVNVSGNEAGDDFPRKEAILCFGRVVVWMHQ